MMYICTCAFLCTLTAKFSSYPNKKKSVCVSLLAIYDAYFAILLFALYNRKSPIYHSCHEGNIFTCLSLSLLCAPNVCTYNSDACQMHEIPPL